MELLIDQSYKTVKVYIQKDIVSIQLYRPDYQNSMNSLMIEELIDVLQKTKKNSKIKIIILEGDKDNFCTGMDFKAVSDHRDDALFSSNPNLYYELLKHITTSSKVIISKVEGKVLAGGIGLIAVSDVVIAGQTATFGLSEVLFGLVPACVMPFLIQRIGYSKAKLLTLSGQRISADEACRIGLVDETTDDVKNAIRKNILKFNRLSTKTIVNVKEYMSDLWIIDEKTQEIAVNKISSLMQDSEVQDNIHQFVKKGLFPWNK